MKRVDIVAGAVIGIFGVWVLIQSLQLPLYIEGVPGPGFFPTVLSTALIVTGVLLVVSRLLGKGPALSEFTLPTAWQARRSLGLWIATLASVLLVGIVGFPGAMVLLVAFLLFGIEGRRNLGAIATVVLTPLLAYAFFGLFLGVPLPMGVFGD